MPQQHNIAFAEPYDKPFRYLVARTVGRTPLGVLGEWLLDARTTNISLINTTGKTIQVGTTSKVVTRCSLAFFKHEQPYAVLEFLDNTRAIFKIDLNEEQPTLKSIDVDLTGYRDVTLTYWRSANKDKLIVTAIGADGIYSGTLDELNNLEMELFNRVEVNDPRRAIHRVGVNVANQLQTEIAEIAING